MELDEDTRRRAEINPLRVLDDKRPEVQAQLGGAPLMVDHLSDSTRAHYDAVRQHLTDLGVTWTEAPKLVRGLDYYTKTTFEFVHSGLGAQSAIGGGGRYDGLSAALGGPDVSGIGYAVGVDRTLLAVQAEGLDVVASAGVQAFVVPLGAEAKRFAVRLVGQLRAAGVAADTVYGDRGLKGAMKAADRSGASHAVEVLPIMRSGEDPAHPRADGRPPGRAVRQGAWNGGPVTRERASQGDAVSRQGVSIAASASERGAERPRRRPMPATEERNECGTEPMGRVR